MIQEKVFAQKEKDTRQCIFMRVKISTGKKFTLLLVLRLVTYCWKFSSSATSLGMKMVCFLATFFSFALVVDSWDERKTLAINNNY